ncbi:MAG: hypothetical protein Q9172_005777 [Xanthocarpia lactea]
MSISKIALVESNLMSSGEFTNAIIIGHDGERWASSDDLSAMPHSERKEIASLWKNKAMARKNGFSVLGKKYTCKTIDDDNLVGSGVDTQLMMEINAAQALSQAEHESSEVLPHGFSSDSLQQQDSIDPSFRIPATHVQSPVQQLRRNLEEGFSGNNNHHSPDRQSPDKVKKKGGGQGPRLRKACDACSKRKVKCDEHQPCKACTLLHIPCMFTRPSKRRGPRNRAADAIREELMTSAAGNDHSRPSSPTYAARTLASLAQQPVPSADNICPPALLHRFVDDYFKFIHPLLPIPHEPSFRAALAAREDLNSPTFLALLASMIGCLVASIPRRPRQHILDLQMEAAFPNSGILIERCRRTALEARGSAYLDRPQTIEDAMIAIFQAFIGAYSWHWDICRLYMGQCVTICRVLEIHKRDGPGTEAAVQAARAAATNAIATGNVREDMMPPLPKTDVVLQELCKRMFWILFSTVTSFQQLGVSARELNIPPPTASEPYPDLPAEVDDAYITPQGTRSMPEGEVPRLVGFNAIMQVYKACADVSAMDVVYGGNELSDWPQQRATLVHALDSVEGVLGIIPSMFLLGSKSSSNEAARQQNYPLPTQGYMGLGVLVPFQNDEPNERKRTAIEIQKANLYGAQLATRSYLLQKYLILSDSFQANNDVSNSQMEDDETTSADVPPASKNGATIADYLVKGRDNLIKDMLELFQNLDLTYIEPNGLSFTNRINQARLTLEATPPDRKTDFHRHVEKYLQRLVDFLVNTQRVGPGTVDGIGEEELRARQWAEMLQPMKNYI